MPEGPVRREGAAHMPGVYDGTGRAIYSAVPAGEFVNSGADVDAGTKLRRK